MRKIFRKGISRLLVLAIMLSIIVLPTTVIAAGPDSDCFGTWSVEGADFDGDIIDAVMTITGTTFEMEVTGDLVGSLAFTIDNWEPIPIEMIRRFHNFRIYAGVFP